MSNTRYHVSTGIASPDVRLDAADDGIGVSIRVTAAVIDHGSRDARGLPTEHHEQTAIVYLTWAAVDHLHQMLDQGRGA